MDNFVSIAWVELDGRHHVPKPVGQGFEHAERVPSIFHPILDERACERIKRRTDPVLTVACGAILDIQLSSCFEIIIVWICRIEVSKFPMIYIFKVIEGN